MRIALIMYAPCIRSDSESADGLAQGGRENVELPRRLGSICCRSGIFFGHLGDMLDTLGNLLDRDVLFAYGIGDGAHRFGHLLGIDTGLHRGRWLM